MADGAQSIMHGGRWKTRVAVAVPMAFIGIFIAFVIANGGVTGAGYAWAGCGEGPTNPSVTMQTNPDSYKYPYGNVTSCRELHRQSHLFGSTDLSVYVLLTTQKGLVAVRVDYHNLGSRLYIADASELATNQVPSGLSDDELAHLAADIAARGGVRPGQWILHYGDG
jgi:hypothetical protein